MSRLGVLILCMCSALFYGCGKKQPSVSSSLQTPSPAASQGVASSPDKNSLTITSSAFQPDQNIPLKYTCSGENVSPELTWKGIPGGAKALALILEDPDAPGGTFSHWVLFNLPPTVNSLEENAGKARALPHDAIEGRNDFNEGGYGGPCPPPGKAHRYHFRLFALDSTLSLDNSATRSSVLKAIEGHVLAEGELTGLFSR